MGGRRRRKWGPRGGGFSSDALLWVLFYPTSLVSSIKLPDSDKNGSTRKSSHLVKTCYFKSYLDELISGMEGCCWLSMGLTDIGTFFPLPHGTFHHTRSPLLVPSTAEDPPLLKTGFFRQIDKGAENTKEKSRQCFKRH
jgi:hypothetical protein